MPSAQLASMNCAGLFVTTIVVNTVQLFDRFKSSAYSIRYDTLIGPKRVNRGADCNVTRKVTTGSDCRIAPASAAMTNVPFPNATLDSPRRVFDERLDQCIPSVDIQMGDSFRKAASYVLAAPVATKKPSPN